MGKRDATRTAAGKPRVSVASLKGGSVTGNIYTSPRSVEGSGAYLKCLYTNTDSMRNKQDELEVSVSSQSYTSIGISWTWWKESHVWHVGMDEYKLFGTDGQVRWRCCTTHKGKV